MDDLPHVANAIGALAQSLDAHRPMGPTDVDSLLDLVVPPPERSTLDAWNGVHGCCELLGIPMGVALGLMGLGIVDDLLLMPHPYATLPYLVATLAWVGLTGMLAACCRIWRPRARRALVDRYLPRPDSVGYRWEISDLSTGYRARLLRIQRASSGWRVGEYPEGHFDSIEGLEAYLEAAEHLLLADTGERIETAGSGRMDRSIQRYNGLSSDRPAIPRLAPPAGPR